MPRTPRVVPALVLVVVALVAGGCTNLPIGSSGSSGDTSAPAGPGASMDLARADIPTLETAMRDGRLNAAGLLAFSTDRIRTLDPGLHAVIAVDPTAADQAAASDRRRAAGTPPGPLEGIPVLVKDNIATGPSQPTTAGSRALADSRPPEAPIVQRLRAAGAVVLGKTNLSEWANYRSTQSASGWSAVGGLTRNAYAPDRTACGSSSGSAVAVAAGYVPAAVGTETDGSIVCPAGTNGVVGIKPDLGLASRSGIVPLSAEQDTPGPITRSVADATLVLSVLQGADPADPPTAEAPAHPVPATVAARPLAGVRLGVLRSADGMSEETDRVYAATLDRLRAQGAVLVDPVTLPGAQAAGDAETKALSTEFAHDIGAYLTGPGVSGPHSLADLVDFDRREAATEMPFFDQQLFEQAAATGGNEADPAYRAARDTATGSSRRDLDAALAGPGGQRLDAVITPTNGPAWSNDLINGDHSTISTSGPAAMSGYPSVTVPMGMTGGLPIGLSLTGGRWSEPSLLAVAAGVEAALPPRTPPTLSATAPSVPR